MLQKSLEEHKDWIESNSNRQLSSYRSLIMSRWPQAKEEYGSSADSLPLVELRNRDTELMAEQNNSSLTVLKDFDTNAAAILLEQECKEVVKESVIYSIANSLGFSS